MTLIAPDYSSRTWADIPSDQRTKIRSMIAAYHEAPDKGLTAWFKTKSQELGMSPGSWRAKYYALRNTGDWQVLARKVDTEPAAIAATREPRFICHLLTLVEKFQRKNSPAFRELRRQWLRRDPIPGYEGHPGWPSLPEGWSPRNLADIVKRETTKAALRSIRVGTSSKTNEFLPHVITTRQGLWPGAVWQFDDMWHNNHVTLGFKRDLVRTLELGAHDVFASHRFHWGAKPRVKKEDGSRENLAGKDMRLFLAGLFHRHGRSRFGTMCMSEHQTAKIEEDIARLLYDSTGGMLRVDYQPIEGKQAALSGFWPGTEGGNFRAKACLESTHNLIQNDSSALPMQTGSHHTGLKGPVTTERIIAYIGRILRDVAKHAPHRLKLLRLPTHDFHTQFIPFLTDYYHFGLAMRTDHDLEAWEALGHVVTEYTMCPGSDQWLSEEAFLALPVVSRVALSEAIRMAPKQWTNRRNLSPLEVWNRRRAEDFVPVPPAVLCEIVGGDLAREVTARRGFLTFEDQDISCDPLIYKAKYCSGPRRGEEIGHGEKVQLVVFPFDDGSTALAVDAKGKFLGELPLYKKVLPINPDAFGSSASFDDRPDIRSEDLKRAAGEKHSRIAEILEPVRIRHAEAVQEARDIKAWNKKVADPDTPVTDAEIAASLSQAAHRAVTTRRVNEWAQESDCDAAAESLQAEPQESSTVTNDQINEWLAD